VHEFFLLVVLLASLATKKIDMKERNEMISELRSLLEKAQIVPNSKYLTAKQIEAEFGVPYKTILNRSNLPSSHARYIPSVRLKSGRKKYFERKVIERLFKLNKPS
jgi:hypothetical protein